MSAVAFRARLTMLRKDHHLTQGQMAEKLGISRPSYTCYELGTSSPTVATLCKIADLFEVNLDYLLGRSDDPSIEAADPKVAMQEISILDRFRKLSPEKRDKLCDMIELFID